MSSTKIEKLTSEQEELIPVIRERWIRFALGLDGDDIDEKKGEEGVKFLYGLAKLKHPQVIWIDGPNSFPASVNDSLRASVNYIVWSSVSDSVNDIVRASVNDSVWHSVSDSVWSSVSDSVRHSWNSLGGDSGFAAWYDFWKELGICQIKEADQYLDFLKSGAFFSWFFEDVAVLCRRPKFIHRTNTGQLHCENGPAIGWRDGFELYFLHGVEFNKDLYLKVTNGMKEADVLKLDNMEQRMAALKTIDPDDMLKSIDAKLVNSSTRGNWLYKVPQGEVFSNDTYLLKYACPSTGRVYVKGVPPEVGELNSADAAQGWSFGLSPEHYEMLSNES